MPDVTQILQLIEDGDARAAEKLLPLVYEELKKLAAVRMAAERGDRTQVVWISRPVSLPGEDDDVAIRRLRGRIG